MFNCLPMRFPYAYLDADGEVLAVIQTEENAREHFYAKEFFVGQLIPYPMSVDCVPISEVSDAAWDRYLESQGLQRDEISW